MKSKILDFVSKKGHASFTDIQRFVYDTSYGEGTYDKHKKEKNSSVRGHYCANFVPNKGYLVTGKSPKLRKRSDGKYEVDAPTVSEKTPLSLNPKIKGSMRIKRFNDKFIDKLLANGFSKDDSENVERSLSDGSTYRGHVIIGKREYCVIIGIHQSWHAKTLFIDWYNAINIRKHEEKEDKLNGQLVFDMFPMDGEVSVHQRWSRNTIKSIHSIERVYKYIFKK